MEWLKDWAVPLSAGATFLLALMAFWSIMESRSARKKDLRDHALDNILTWAEVLDKTIAASIFDFSGADRNIRMREILDVRRQLITIAKVARNIKNNELSSLVDKVRSSMDEYVEVPEDKSKEEKRQELRRSIKKLIDTIIEIKYSQ